MMESTPQLSGVTPLIQVRDLPESLAYYETILGFAIDFCWPEEGPPRWAMISRGDVHFMLTIDLGTSSGEFIAEKGNGVVFYITTNQIEALYAELDAKGALIVQDMMTFGERRQFSISDLNGYVITFSEPFV
ncbi:MAG: VOC family protein [Anaerolineae bacterium]|nr:VOC family protein [Anaerolineae bacterium]